MILPQLLWRFVHHRDDPEFYRMQALDAIAWIEESGIPVGPGVRVLDLGLSLIHISEPTRPY